MSGPRIGVLALQGDVREHDRALRTVGAEPVHVRRLADLDGVAGLVLPGGESTTISRLLEVFELLEPLRAKVREGLPVYGSCAGMILLADEVLDGRPDQQGIGGLDVVVRRNAFGRQVDSFESEVVWSGGERIPAVFIRAPWVEEVGDGVEVLAEVRGGVADGRAVAVRFGYLLATSFHPELTGDDRVHRYFVEMVSHDVRQRGTRQRGIRQRS